MKLPKVFGLIVTAFFVAAFSQSASAASFNDQVRGRILLQVESKGEAWYVNPNDGSRRYLADGNAAYGIMRSLGIGVTNADLEKIPVGIEQRAQDADTDGDGLPDKLEEALGTDPTKADTDGDGHVDGEEVQRGYSPLGSGRLITNPQFAGKLKGKIFLQVQSRGQAWYINPVDGKRYYLKDGNTAYQIMRYLGLGITTVNLNKIPQSGEGKTPTASQNSTTNSVPPPAPSNNDGDCSTIVGGVKYQLSPCTVEANLIDGQGDQPFSFYIITSNKNESYGYELLNALSGLPDNALRHAESAGAVGDREVKAFFIDEVLNANGNSQQSYQGYLPVTINNFDRSDIKDMKLHFNINVLPGGSSESTVVTPPTLPVPYGCGPTIVGGREFTLGTCNLSLTYKIGEGDKPFAVEVTEKFLDGQDHSFWDYLNYSIYAGPGLGFPDYTFTSASSCGIPASVKPPLGDKQALVCNLGFNSYAFSKGIIKPGTYQGYFQVTISNNQSSDQPIRFSVSTTLVVLPN